MLNPVFVSGHITATLQSLDAKNDTVTVTDDRAPDISTSFAVADLPAILKALGEISRRIKADDALHFRTDRQMAA